MPDYSQRDYLLGPSTTMNSAEGEMLDKRILVIDDDGLIQDLFALALRDEGYTVAEANQQLDRRPFDLVIADWHLPDGNGIHIADRAAAQGIKAFVITGFFLSSPGGRAAQHEILTKPVRPIELIAAVERSIGKASVT
jgi:DNA-binding response OmpR family regulator